MTTTDARPPAQVTDPLVYTPESRHSFFADIVRAAQRDPDARRRLDVHREQTRAAVLAQRAREENARVAMSAIGVEFRVSPNTQLGTGGEFTPPAWLISLFGAQAAAGRVLADVIGSTPLPANVSSVHIPRFSAGGQTGVTPGTGGPAVSTDETSYDVNSPVATISGYVDVSQQLLEQTPGGYDAIAFVDLGKNYNKQLDSQLFNGTGVNGQVTGLANVVGGGTPSTTPPVVSGATATTFTQLWPLYGQAVAGVGNARAMPVQHVFMSPRRWAWIASSLDASNRPIAQPDMVPMQSSGWPQASATRTVGSVFGKPVWETGALNTGTAPDTTFFLRPAEMLLFESSPVFTVNPNPLSGTLQSRLRMHQYVAFIGHRYPGGIGSVVNVPAPVNF